MLITYSYSEEGLHFSIWGRRGRGADFLFKKKILQNYIFNKYLNLKSLTE